MSITLADLSVMAARVIPSRLACDSANLFTVPPDEALLVKSGRFALLDDGEIKDEGEDTAASTLVRSR